MDSNTVSSYLAWITPTPGDPTHSLLRAHLVFEQLIDAFLEKTLAHASALSDARFTFSQKLAMARAIAQGFAPSHWTWQAVARLNKIRNSLAHSPGPKLAHDLHEYVEYCVKHSGNPLPSAPGPRSSRAGTTASTANSAYTAADLVTIGLYIALASRLGFNVSTFAGPDSAA
jgi:hypothetical protein